MKRTTTTVAALTLSSLAFLTACTDADGTAADPTTTRSAATTTESNTSTPSSTPSTTSPAERDAKAAQQAVVRFLALYDELANNPKSSLNRLATVARGQALAQWRTTLFRQRVKGWRQIGSVKIVSTTASKRTSQRYKVTACIDVDKVNIVDRDGKSVVAANRPPRTRDTYIADRTPQGWFVTGEEFQVTTC